MFNENNYSNASKRKNEQVVQLNGRKRQTLIAVKEAQQYENRVYDNEEEPFEIQRILQRCAVMSPSYNLRMAPDINELGVSKSAINKNIIKMGKQYVEGILDSNSGTWVLITQLEMYFKDKNFDDCSDNSEPFKDESESGHHKIIVEQKGDKKKYVEMKILYDKFEVLITGGIYCVDGHILSFLGSSAPKALYNEKYCISYLATSPANSIPCIRLLRDFRKEDSLNKWAFKSKLYVNKGLETYAVLRYKDDQPSFHTIVSFILYIGSKNQIVPVNIERCKTMLMEVEFWKELGIIRNFR